MYRKHSGPEELRASHSLRSTRFVVSAVSIVMLAASAFGHSQQSPAATESVAEAARIERERRANSTNHPRIITNAEFQARYGDSSPSAFSLPDASTNAAQVSTPPSASCNNAQVEELQAELQDAQRDLDRQRDEFSRQPVVISGNNLDLRNFKPANSGFYIGALPAAEAQPLAPPRVSAAELGERITSLEKELRRACESPEAAEIDNKLDAAEQQLSQLERAFDLDRETYYSQPDYIRNTAGKAQLDAEEQQIRQLQAEIEALRNQLLALNPPSSAT